jgi:hypothetical protein
MQRGDSPSCFAPMEPFDHGPVPRLRASKGLPAS